MAIESNLLPTDFYQPLVRTPALPQCEVCVIVPVKNEAELLESCLKALANQVDLQGASLDFKRYEVILLANNCTDNSVAIARQFARQHPEFQLHIIDRVLPPSQAYIGRVRQMLMDEAYYRLAGLGLAGVGSKRGVIASTDGDTQVSSVWIAATLLELARGVDAVGGRIVADATSCAALDPQLKTRYLRGDHYHQLLVELESHIDGNSHDRWPRHAQHYGASLAVTAQMYRQAGGIPAVRTPEDVAFYRSLLRVGARFRHSPLVQVTTSARQTVRTEGGFAAQLNEWAAMGQHHQEFLVEAVGAIEARFYARRQLRHLWRRVAAGYRHTVMDVNLYANTLGINAHWLSAELKQLQPFDLLFERIGMRQQQEGIWQQRWPLVNLECAIADLTARLTALRSQHITAVELPPFRTQQSSIGRSSASKQPRSMQTHMQPSA
jgi:glycosyltransferase involved in cell wall biosynthesis